MALEKPNIGPSNVRVVGKQLLVSKRLPSGKLDKEEPFFIRGVCWSPASLTTKDDRWARQKEFAIWAGKDLTMMQSANINAVYVFLDFGLGKEALSILDKLYEHGIMAIPTVDLDGTYNMERLKEVVTAYKDHPAILFWAIGNEWNINWFHGHFKSLGDSARGLEEAAKLVKSIDAHHPVASIFGEIIIPNQNPSTSEIVNTIAKSVDIWGLNIYRGGTFGKLFEEWKSVTEKPFFFSEYGTDSFYTTKFWPAVGRVDEPMQAVFIKSLIEEMFRESSARDPKKNCLGGTIFAWNDEWWKVQVKHGGSPDRQDTGGFPTPWNKYSHPDAFANEEYFGIVKLNREPKQAYHEVRDTFKRLMDSAKTPTNP